MTKGLRFVALVIFAWLPFVCPLSIVGDAAAQDTRNISKADSEAVRILDEPGGSTEDPDEAFEYLDEVSLGGRSMEKLHSNPETSWLTAHTELRSRVPSDERGSSLNRHEQDSVMHFWFRSRGGSAIDPYAQHGFLANDYLGAPTAYYNRIRARSPFLDLGFAQQKQAWEPDFTDRLSGYAALRHPVEIAEPLSIDRAIVGDYALAFGDGLLFGGGASTSKTLAAVGAVEQRAFGIRGALGNASGCTMRGGAVQVGIEPVASWAMRVMFFASQKAIDASISSDTIQTLYTTDYHRTASELATRNSAEARVTGLRASIANSDTGDFYVSAGCTAYKFSYDHPFAGTSSAPFIGNAVQAAGVDFLAVGHHLSFTGEAALSANDTMRTRAVTAACVFQASRSFGFSVNYRHIPYGFISPFGEISGSSLSSLTNADGFYLGVQVTPIEHLLRINAYADIENNLLPIKGLFDKQKHDYLAAGYFTPLSGFDISLAFRNLQNESIGTVQGVDRLNFATIDGSQTSIRFEADLDAVENLNFKSRYEHVSVTPNPATSQSGFLLMEQITLKLPPVRSRLAFSTSRFQTDSFKSAVYLYEASVPGAGAIVLLDGNGWRVSMRSSTQILRELSISLAGAGSIYDAPRTIGNGLTARVAKTAFDFTAQLDFTF